MIDVVKIANHITLNMAKDITSIATSVAPLISKIFCRPYLEYRLYAAIAATNVSKVKITDCVNVSGINSDESIICLFIVTTNLIYCNINRLN